MIFFQMGGILMILLPDQDHDADSGIFEVIFTIAEQDQLYEFG